MQLYIIGYNWATEPNRTELNLHKNMAVLNSIEPYT